LARTTKVYWVAGVLFPESMAFAIDWGYRKNQDQLHFLVGGRKSLKVRQWLTCFDVSTELFLLSKDGTDRSQNAWHAEGQ